MARTLKPRAGKPAQGRPLGFLIAWMKCADDFTDQPSHSAASMSPAVFVDERFNFANRSAARAWGADNCPEWMTLSGSGLDTFGPDACPEADLGGEPEDLC